MWRKLHNEDLHNLYSYYGYQMKERNITGHVACTQQMRNAHKILFRKLTRERQQLKDITLISENNMLCGVDSADSEVH